MEKVLKKIAGSIPSQGGREIGDYISECASLVSDGDNIVEVGSWLGAGTAQACLGIRKGGKKVKLHVYDRFQAGATEVKKAKKQGVNLKSKQNTLPLVKDYIRPFECNVNFYKTSIQGIKKFDHGLIGLYIDDASKRDYNFNHVMKVFKPNFIPGQTIVILMDYFYFEKKPDQGLDYQFKYMQDNDSFEFIKRLIPDKSPAAFLYKG